MMTGRAAALSTHCSLSVTCPQQLIVLIKQGFHSPALQFICLPSVCPLCHFCNIACQSVALRTGSARGGREYLLGSHENREQLIVLVPARPGCRGESAVKRVYYSLLLCLYVCLYVCLFCLCFQLVFLLLISSVGLFLCSFSISFACFSQELGMCRIDFLFQFGFSSVFEKTRIRFVMSLVQLSSKNAVRFGYYSYLQRM